MANGCTIFSPKIPRLSREISGFHSTLPTMTNLPQNHAYAFFVAYYRLGSSLLHIGQPTFALYTHANRRDLQTIRRVSKLLSLAACALEVLRRKDFGTV
jgi:hypothetical protein